MRVLIVQAEGRTEWSESQWSRSLGRMVYRRNEDGKRAEIGAYILILTAQCDDGIVYRFEREIPFHERRIASHEVRIFHGEDISVRVHGFEHEVGNENYQPKIPPEVKEALDRAERRCFVALRLLWKEGQALPEQRPIQSLTGKQRDLLLSLDQRCRAVGCEGACNYGWYDPIEGTDLSVARALYKRDLLTLAGGNQPRNAAAHITAKGREILARK